MSSQAESVAPQEPEREDPDAAQAEHYCPYQAEINDDYETLCTCSLNQMQQCIDDI